MMYGPRNYFNRISQLHSPGQSFAVHQSFYGYRMHHRGPRGYKMHQNGYVKFGYQPNYGYYQNHQSHFASLMQGEYYGNSKPQTHFRGYHNNLPAGVHSANSGFYQRASSMTTSDYHQVNYKNMHPKPFNNDARAQHSRAIRGAVEDSLFPHGDPVPEDYLGDWDQRPECPRIKWTIPENPSWQPAFIPHNGDYTGTELILARELEAQRSTSSGLTNSYDDTHTNSPGVSESTVEKAAFSDSSSMKSGSSFDSY